MFKITLRQTRHNFMATRRSFLLSPSPRLHRTPHSEDNIRQYQHLEGAKEACLVRVKERSRLAPGIETIAEDHAPTDTFPSRRDWLVQVAGWRRIAHQGNARIGRVRHKSSTTYGSELSWRAAADPGMSGRAASLSELLPPCRAMSLLWHFDHDFVTRQFVCRGIRQVRT